MIHFRSHKSPSYINLHYSDWEWGQQDGGEGKTGRVMEIRGWDNESCRSVANVSWVSGSTNVYRLGHKGNVDLKYTVPAPGGYIYKDHMPVLGQRDEQQPVVQATRPSFFVGDRVRVCLDKESLMRLQQGETLTLIPLRSHSTLNSLRSWRVEPSNGRVSRQVRVSPSYN